MFRAENSFFFLSHVPFLSAGNTHNNLMLAYFKFGAFQVSVRKNYDEAERLFNLALNCPEGQNPEVRYLSMGDAVVVICFLMAVNATDLLVVRYHVG